MSGVITVANCNHFAAGECWSACLLLVLKTNKQKKERVRLVEAARQQSTCEVCNDYLRPAWSFLRRMFYF